METRIFTYIDYDNLIEDGKRKFNTKKNLTMLFYDLIMDTTFTATPSDYNRFSMTIPIAKIIDKELVCFNRDITLKDYFSDIEIFLGKVAFENDDIREIATKISKNLKYYDVLDKICTDNNFNVDACIEEYCKHIKKTNNE